MRSNIDRKFGGIILFFIKWGVIYTIGSIIGILAIIGTISFIIDYPKTFIMMFFILILIFYVAGKNHKKSITNYFLQNQAGDIESIKKHTKLTEDQIRKTLKELLNDEKIILILPDQELYKWTEDRDYPRGMISREITL
jgi:uncharacterized membrane protein